MSEKLMDMNTLEQAKKDFLKTCAETGLSASTIKSYGSDINHLIRFLSKKYKIQHVQLVSEPHLREFIKNLEGRLTPGTTKRKLVGLRRFFAFNDDVVKIDPSTFKYSYKYTPSPTRIPPDDLKTFLEQIYSAKDSKEGVSRYCVLRDIVILEIILGTGMKLTEISNLKFSSIDFKKKAFFLNEPTNPKPKNPVGKRKIPFGSKALYDVLVEYQVNPIFGEFFDGENLFYRRNKGPISYQTINQRLSFWSTKIGVVVTGQALRDTLAFS